MFKKMILVIYFISFFIFFQVQFQGAEDYWESTPPVRQSNSYTAETVPGRGVSPNSGGIPLPPNGVPYSPPQQGNCDPTIMNGNGPPRLRPPPPGAVGPPGRSPSLESSARPPGGPPPRTRVSRTPMSPEEIAQRSKELDATQNFVRDCFIIPQESVERFLPDGISVRKKITNYNSLWDEGQKLNDFVRCI